MQSSILGTSTFHINLHTSITADLYEHESLLHMIDNSRRPLIESMDSTQLRNIYNK